MNGTHVARQFPLLTAIGALAFGFLPANPVRAADIQWNAPTIIASTSFDVSLNGSLVYAYNFGSTGVNPVLDDVLVNGVIFARFAVPHQTNTTSVTVGSVTLDVNALNRFYTTNELTGSSSGPFANLIPAYKTLLQSGVSTESFNGTLTLTLGGLTSGQSYLVEFWTNNSGSSLITSQTAGTTYTAGNVVTLDDNNTQANGGVGRWVIGSFTADASTEVVTLRSSTPASDYPVVNAFQLRVVPEPSSALLLLSGAALCLRRRTGR